MKNRLADSYLLMAAMSLLLLLALFAAGCDEKAEGENTSEIIIASTTSTKDSGLFDVLLPAFEQAFPAYKVKVNAVGTGEALKLGERCDADVVLVHAPEPEKKFVADGYGTERREVMYNDFLIAGPARDPADVETAPNAADAFHRIAITRSDFVSRGDDSGTHKAELKVWEKSGVVRPNGVWYKSIGQGMGETLRVASEIGAYTLTDRGTWLSLKNRLPGLVILLEGDQILFNQYGVIPVNPVRCPQVNALGAGDFAGWLVSPEGQRLIGEYGKETYGQALFVPNAK